MAARLSRRIGPDFGGRQAVAGSACTVATEDDAERVTDGIGEDAKACLTFSWDTGGTQSKEFPLGPVRITHANIEVHLLGIHRVRPARRNPWGRPLKGQLPKTRSQADDHPTVDVLVDPHAEHPAVELRESARVRAVDHCLFETSDHAWRMPGHAGDETFRSSADPHAVDRCLPSPAVGTRSDRPLRRPAGSKNSSPNRCPPGTASPGHEREEPLAPASGGAAISLRAGLPTNRRMSPPP
jgi:hypothetical protein